MTFLLVALLLFGGSCGGGSLVPSDYRTRFRLVRACRPTIEHQAPAGRPTRITHINVYINPESAAAYMMNSNALPAGTVVIKEEHDDANCNRLIAWSIARKEPGFDPAGGDWHWQHVLADHTIDADGRAMVCSNTGCHGATACRARDWMCTEP